LAVNPLAPLQKKAPLEFSSFVIDEFPQRHWYKVKH